MQTEDRRQNDATFRLPTIKGLGAFVNIRRRAGIEAIDLALVGWIFYCLGTGPCRTTALMLPYAHSARSPATRVGWTNNLREAISVWRGGVSRVTTPMQVRPNDSWDYSTSASGMCSPFASTVRVCAKLFASDFDNDINATGGRRSNE